MAPARTADDIVRKLNASIRETVSLTEVRDYYENRGAGSMTSTPDEMRV